MKKLLSISALLFALLFGAQAQAAGQRPVDMTASGAIVGTQVLWCQTPGTVVDRACTFTQVATFINSLFSGDCTVTSGGVITCTGPTHLSGTAPSLTAGNVTTNANLTGDVTSVGNATTLTNAPVIAKVLTGFTSGAGTVSAADSILSALQKINGNVALNAPLASPTFTGVPAAPTATVGTNTTQLATTAFVIANAGSGTGANPTATAGPTAVNGVATTFMRSDAAPPVQKASNAQFGIMEGDGSTVTCVAGVCTAVPGVTSRTVTGATDTILAGDRGNVVYYNSASSIAVSQPAPSGSFASGFFTTLCNINTGIPTITPGSGTIINAATYAIPAGISFASASCVSYQSDGTNFNAVDIQAAYGTGVQAALGKATNATGGFGTVGTSGATLPLLNGTNTFSGTQTFGSVFGTVTAQSGTTYTLASTDCGTEIAFTNAAAITVTIPAALTTGCNIALLQTTSAGQVTVTGTAVSAATLHSAHSYTKTFGQWAIIGINIETTGVAILTGDGA